jgi:hypothetical protein
VSGATIYRVTWDPARFQYLLYDLPHPGLELFQFNGTPRLDTWTKPPVYVYEPRLERPDIWHIVTAAVLVASPPIIEMLEPFVSEAGELLPVQLTENGETLYALNILRDFDCLESTDADLSELRLYPNFMPHRLPESGLLKIPQVDTTHIFCLERDDDAESFRARIERHGLTGLTFELVWSEVSGPKPINLILE